MGRQSTSAKKSEATRPYNSLVSNGVLASSVVCADNRTYLKSLRNDSAALVVTSPPYNIGKAYERRESLPSYVQQQRAVIEQAVRILHPQGSICWQIGNYVEKGEVAPLDIILYPIFRELGLKLRNRIIWHFDHGLHCTKRLSGRYETILWFTKTDDYVFNLDPIRIPQKYPSKKHYKGPNAGRVSSHPLGKNPGDVWVIPNVKHNHVEKTEHPCQFPVELIERLVLALTNPGDLVVDPYAGVGSSVLAAEKNGRVGIGCDTSVKYVHTASTRLRLLRDGKLRLRPMNRQVFAPPKGQQRAAN